MRHPRQFLLILLLALCAWPASAAMRADPVEWTLGDRTFRGVLVYDDANAIARPGLVMVPDWMGMTDGAIAKAKHIAGNDYVVLVADVYGRNAQPKDSTEARALVGALYKDIPELRARIDKALEVLRANVAGAPLDASRIADIAAVVTFHGGLDTSMPASKSDFKPSVLVLNGADDQGTAGDVAGFKQEMDAAGVDWQFVDFSDTVHCFALPDADNPPGCVYNPLSAERAERMMRGFLAERFSDRD